METCEVPCKSVSDAIEIVRKLVGEKVSYKILVYVIAGIMGISAVLLNAKMETIGVRIQAIQTSMEGIAKEVRSFNYRTSIRGPRGD